MIINPCSLTKPTDINLDTCMYNTYIYCTVHKGKMLSGDVKGEISSSGGVKERDKGKRSSSTV